MNNNEYRVNIKITNNLIMSKIESLGYKSILPFCKDYNICYQTVVNLINMKRAPIKGDRSYRDIVYKLCDIFKCVPEELFSSVQMEKELETNKRSYQVKEAELKFLLENKQEQKLLEDIVDEELLIDDIKYFLSKLTPKEAQVIRYRFGIGEDEHTLEQCGKILNVHRERVRQIEAKALRKLRHPFVSNWLKNHLE